MSNRISQFRNGIRACRSNGNIVIVGKQNRRDGSKSIYLRGGMSFIGRSDLAHINMPLGDFLHALGITAEDCRKALGEE